MRQALGALVVLAVVAAPAQTRVRFATYAEVRAMLAAVGNALPPGLGAPGRPPLESEWTAWVGRHDREIRDRLQRGDADTLVNWLLFGTTFTQRPRALVDPPPGNGAPAAGEAEAFLELVTARARDLVEALARPGRDERRLFARRFFERAGFGVGTPAARHRLEEHLRSEVVRFVGEQQTYKSGFEAADARASGRDAFFARSNLFRDRGVSLDTTLLPNFALEQGLQQMRAAGLIRDGSVRRVAIVGPGLDFADKSTGYDFYPPQTVQPFAVLDALTRLGLSDPSASLQLTTLDISPRVNEHLVRARQGARRGAPYVLQLPLELGGPWSADVVSYWKRVGDRIGVEAPSARPPPIGDRLELRTIAVRPQAVLQVAPEDVDIVTQRITGAAFDLVVATNVFVYYDAFEQSLALENVAAMLRPGGFLLANDALPEHALSAMRAAGYATVRYSDRSDVADNIVWYERRAR